MTSNKKLRARGSKANTGSDAKVLKAENTGVKKSSAPAKTERAAKYASVPAPLMELVSTFLKEHGYEKAHQDVRDETQRREALEGSTKPASWKGASTGYPKLVTLFEDWQEDRDLDNELPSTAKASFGKDGEKEDVAMEDTSGTSEDDSSESEDASGDSDEQSSSEDEDSDSSAADEDPRAGAKAGSESEESSDSSESESESESESGSETAGVKVVSVDVPAASSSSDEESDSDLGSSDDESSEESDEVEPPAAPASAKPSLKRKRAEPEPEPANVPLPESDTSSSSSDEQKSADEDSDSDSGSDSNSDSSKQEDSDSGSDSDFTSESEAEKAGAVITKVEVRPVSTGTTSSFSSSNASSIPKHIQQKHDSDSSVTLGASEPETGAEAYNKRKRATEDSQEIVDVTTTAADGTRSTKRMKRENVPFSRIDRNMVVDEKFASNAYVPYDYAEQAHRDLIVTKGKGFTKEKNKKKRGSYRGGLIDTTPRGIKFDD